MWWCDYYYVIMNGTTNKNYHKKCHVNLLIHTIQINFRSRIDVDNNQEWSQHLLKRVKVNPTRERGGGPWWWFLLLLWFVSPECSNQGYFNLNQPVFNFCILKSKCHKCPMTFVTLFSTIFIKIRNFIIHFLFYREKKIMYKNENVNIILKEQKSLYFQYILIYKLKY